MLHNITWSPKKCQSYSTLLGYKQKGLFLNFYSSLAFLFTVAFHSKGQTKGAAEGFLGNRAQSHKATYNAGKI